jgi:diacylglycerol kinase
MGNENSSIVTVIKKAWEGLKGYLKDWRNLLGHALLGIVFVVLAIWVPINIWVKLAIIACLIAFNIFRMRRKASRASTKDMQDPTKPV